MLANFESIDHALFSKSTNNGFDMIGFHAPVMPNNLELVKPSYRLLPKIVGTAKMPHMPTSQKFIPTFL